MPHITVEYSANMIERPKAKVFLRTLHDALVGCGPYKMEDIKSRLVRYDNFLVSNGEKEQAFVHLHLAIMPRDTEIHKKTTATLLELLKKEFATSMETKNCALSVEIRLLDKDSYIKAGSGTLL
jgi:5-carboxymethyl-2-hydroxymuconate isomerase